MCPTDFFYGCNISAPFPFPSPLFTNCVFLSRAFNNVIFHPLFGSIVSLRVRGDNLCVHPIFTLQEIFALSNTTGRAWHPQPDVAKQMKQNCCTLMRTWTKVRITLTIITLPFRLNILWWWCFVPFKKKYQIINLEVYVWNITEKHFSCLYFFIIWTICSSISQLFGSIASIASNRLTTFVFPDMTIKEIRSPLVELDMYVSCIYCTQI